MFEILYLKGGDAAKHHLVRLLGEKNLDLCLHATEHMLAYNVPESYGTCVRDMQLTLRCVGESPETYWSNKLIFEYRQSAEFAWKM